MHILFIIRVGVDFFLDLINNHEEIRQGIPSNTCFLFFFQRY